MSSYWYVFSPGENPIDWITFLVHFNPMNLFPCPVFMRSRSLLSHFVCGTEPNLKLSTERLAERGMTGMMVFVNSDQVFPVFPKPFWMWLILWNRCFSRAMEVEMRMCVWKEQEIKPDEPLIPLFTQQVLLFIVSNWSKELKNLCTSIYVVIFPDC